MTTKTQYRSPTYDGFSSSPEVLQAIAVVAGEDYEPPADTIDAEEYDTISKFWRVWAEPTDEEDQRVVALAWDLAHPEDEELFWGESTLRRP